MKKLKEKLNAKLSKNGGFTLVEMLIVVAIIAILIAVSIPLVSNALDKAKHATDAANERAAKAELVIQYLADDEAIVGGTTTKIKVDQIYYYDAQNGRLVLPGTALDDYGQHGDHKRLALKIDKDGLVTMQWAVNNTLQASEVVGNNLCGNHDVDSAH